LTVVKVRLSSKNSTLKFNQKNKIMAKSQDAKKTVKKEPLKTAKEKKEEKREKKNNPKRD
jgi:hypothetical protein